MLALREKEEQGEKGSRGGENDLPLLNSYEAPSLT